MSALTATCPSCGAPITFKSGSSLVVICNYCHSAVARTDRELRDIGRVAELVETGSPLQLGLRGVWRGEKFELTGRAQMGHQAGGVWDEWYATFDNGYTGWLAEAQGRFYFTFPEKTEISILPIEKLNYQGRSRIFIRPNIPLVVAEIGFAKILGARGEIPYVLTPDATFYYADLAGQNGVFATIDYGETPPAVYMGQEVTLSDLGLSDARAAEREARRVAAASLNCPNCGGPLALQAPDFSERVTCPNCNGLLDVNQGKLSYLKSLGTLQETPAIPIGSVAEFRGANFILLGFLKRSVEIDGTKYFWTEYLLYNPQIGFRWLVDSDDHWNFVEPVSPGEVTESKSSVTFRGKVFKGFQNAQAQVEYVMGEFYWKVEVGETVWATDYVRPPEMLSREVTTYPHVKGSSIETGEVTWSLGTYVKRKEIEKKFKVSLPSPGNVAPNQPFLLKGIYAYWAILVLLLFIVALFSLLVTRSNDVLSRNFHFEPLQNSQATQVLFSEPFDVIGRRNIRVTGLSKVSNSWIYVAGDFVNEDTGLVQTFELPIEYYYGVEDGESWTEGSQQASTLLSALPAGKYTLRLEAQWGPEFAQPANIDIKIDEGHVSLKNLLMTLLAISAIPILIGIRHIRFEKRRWSESSFFPT